jgi:hypothetical protein
VGRVKQLKRTLGPADGLWIAWPKKASGIETDLDFAAVESVGLGAGLVDNKSCAVDESWQAVRFVYRLEDRGPQPRARGSRAPRPSSPGRPLTPTAPTRRPSSNAATPPLKNVKNGSKLASSAGSSRTLFASAPVVV